MIRLLLAALLFALPRAAPADRTCRPSPKAAWLATRR